MAISYNGISFFSPVVNMATQANEKTEEKNWGLYKIIRVITG